MRIRRLVAATVLPLAVVLPACSSSSKPKAAAAGQPAGTGIVIKNFSFSPNPLRVAAGATVQVRDADGTAHTVQADDKTSFDTGRIEGGATKSLTAPTKPGTYSYHCNIHDYMKGTLVVS